MTPPLWRTNAGETCVYEVTGTQLVVRWHESQDLVVTKWLAGLPLAPEPLWQVTQEFGAMPVCVKFAGTHAVVRWHESHDIDVGRCLPGLPLAAAPLWQVKHAPGVTPTWLNLPGGATGGEVIGGSGAERGGATGGAGGVTGGATTGVGGEMVGGDFGGETGKVDGGAATGTGPELGGVVPVPGGTFPDGTPPVVVPGLAGVGRWPSSKDVVL